MVLFRHCEDASREAQVAEIPTKRRRGAMATQSQAQFTGKLITKRGIASQRTLAMMRT